jgi:hypothetical protein
MPRPIFLGNARIEQTIMKMQIARMSLRRCAWLCSLFMLLVAGACSSLLETEAHTIRNGRVTVTGTSPVPMLLITSTNFTATRAENGSLLVDYVAADTAVITLPFDRSYSFGQTDRFVVKLANSDSDTTADIEMRVFTDGSESYRQRATMKDSSLEFVFYQSF